MDSKSLKLNVHMEFGQVIIRSQGSMAELRFVLAVRGNIIVLDQVEPSIQLLEPSI